MYGGTVHVLKEVWSNFIPWLKGIKRIAYKDWISVEITWNNAFFLCISQSLQLINWDNDLCLDFSAGSGRGCGGGLKSLETRTSFSEILLLTQNTWEWNSSEIRIMKWYLNATKTLEGFLHFKRGRVEMSSWLKAALMDGWTDSHTSWEYRISKSLTT